MFSRGQLFATPWAVDCLAPLSTGFSRQEYCSGLPFPHPGELPDPGAKPASPALEADFSTAEPSGKSRWGYSKWNKPVTKRQMLCDPSHLYEVPRVVKLLDPERKEVAATGWGEVIEERGEGELFNEYEFQFCRIKWILEIGWVTVWICFTLPNCVPTNSKDSKFCYVYFTAIL